MRRRARRRPTRPLRACICRRRSWRCGGAAVRGTLRVGRLCPPVALCGSAQGRAPPVSAAARPPPAPSQPVHEPPAPFPPSGHSGRGPRDRARLHPLRLGLGQSRRGGPGLGRADLKCGVRRDGRAHDARALRRAAEPPRAALRQEARAALAAGRLAVPLPVRRRGTRADVLLRRAAASAAEAPATAARPPAAHPIATCPSRPLRTLAFSPGSFPVLHPCDRQSSLHLPSVDLAAHPRFAHAQPYEVLLSPGDVLYIPQYARATSPARPAHNSLGAPPEHAPLALALPSPAPRLARASPCARVSGIGGTTWRTWTTTA